MKAILFDVDGTLLDTREFIFRAFEHVFRLHDLPHLTREDVLVIGGKSLEDCYAILAPEREAAVLCKTHRTFQEQNMDLGQLFPNTLDTLKKLKQTGIQMGAVTNRYRQTGLRSLTHSGLLPFLDVVIAGDDVTYPKPHPEGLDKALKQLNVVPEDAAMVGDSPGDIEAGKSAGTITVAATYGFSSKDHLATFNPDHAIDDISEMVSIFS